MRALELRQWAVHGGISGVSAVIAPDGTIHARAGRFHETTMLADVRARQARSLYFRTGDIFALILAAVAALATATSVTRRRLQKLLIRRKANT